MCAEAFWFLRTFREWCHSILAQIIENDKTRVFTPTSWCELAATILRLRPLRRRLRQENILAFLAVANGRKPALRGLVRTSRGIRSKRSIQVNRWGYACE